MALEDPDSVDFSAIARGRGYQGESLLVEHASPRPVSSCAVLVLGPHGYADTSAYRPLRLLADLIAHRGYRVQRLDWPGLGDSAGDALDPDLLGRQITAVKTAVAGLRDRGFGQVVGIGVGLGALLGLAVGSLDGLVAWALPTTGKRAMRAERAFHKLAAKSYGSPPPGAVHPPAGAVEAGGFLYGPQTVRGLEELDAAALIATHAPARVLLLPQDGGTAPAKVVAALEAAGSEVVLGEADGLGDLLESAYQAALSVAVREAILAWLPTDGHTFTPPPPTWAPALTPMPGVEERLWVQEGGAGDLVGILCRPTAVTEGRDWTLFFNAGGIRRCGPNRLWTRAARALAEEGRPSLRFDVRDVGDSDGSSEPHPDLEAMYAESAIADAVQAVDALRALGATSVDVVGLCSGAFLGVQVALRREVRRAVLFNGLAYVWNDDARASSMTSQIGRSLLDARRWHRLLTGRIDARALARSIGSKARLRAGDLRDRLGGVPPPNEVARVLRDVQARGTDLQLVSSAGDPSIAYLDRHLSSDQRPPLTLLPGVDHTIRPAWAHARVVQLIMSGATKG